FPAGATDAPVSFVANIGALSLGSHTIGIRSMHANGAWSLDYAKTFSVGETAAALDFDGVNDYVSIPHNSLLKPSAQITIEAWVRPTNIHTNRYYEIYRKEDGERHLLSFQEFGTVLSFGLVTNGQYTELDVPITPANYEGQWVHVAATYDGIAKKIY